MFLGVPTYFAANLRATHARRARPDELLGTVLGGALLGIMIGRLLAIPGAALVTIVGIVTTCVYLQDGTRTLFSPYTGWAAWTPGMWIDVIPGSPAWHLVYIASLCLMAACGALATHPQWRRTTLGIGAAATLLTITAAIAQLR
jgi:hypothetical protein